MNRQLIAYANTLSLVVLAQSLKIAQMQQQMDASTDALARLSETTKALLKDTFGEVEIFEMEG